MSHILHCHIYEYLEKIKEIIEWGQVCPRMFKKQYYQKKIVYNLQYLSSNIILIMKCVTLLEKRKSSSTCIPRKHGCGITR